MTVGIVRMDGMGGMGDGWIGGMALSELQYGLDWGWNGSRFLLDLQPLLSLAVWLSSRQSQTDLVMWLTDAGIYKVRVGLYFTTLYKSHITVICARIRLV